MLTTHNLGFSRIVGQDRKGKKAVEKYWKKEINQEELVQIGKEIRAFNYSLQEKLDLIPTGDFSFYDHVLDTSYLFGVIPERFKKTNLLDTTFNMARGNDSAKACKMVKYLNTNYHIIAPELQKNQNFELNCEEYLSQIRECKKAKPVILGPLSYLWFASGDFNKLDLLQPLTEQYLELIKKIKQENITWIQMDEPILGFELSSEWKSAFENVYHQFAGPIKILLTTYFADIQHNLSTILNLPTAGLHIDLASSKEQLLPILNNAKYKVLSCGIINGRNIWKADLNDAYEHLARAYDTIGDNLWIAPSCSLLHCPVDVSDENKLNPEIKNWLSFSKQKIEELDILKQALVNGKDSVKSEFEKNKKIIQSKKTSTLINLSEVQDKINNITPEKFNRPDSLAKRQETQTRELNLPLFPTTTIGSYPQTKEIRRTRNLFKNNKISQEEYEDFMKKEIDLVIKKQEEIGLDVLVHGEPERNDMVEYFSEYLTGFAFTEQGWVQSYGSRCVKPPIIYGDIKRKEPMTVKWAKYAQSTTSRKVKGMLTGPVTIIAWSFVREDQPLKDTAYQIAFALKDELKDLEDNGINIIQIDEAAFREALPINKKQQKEYLDWSIKSFSLSTSSIKPSTQIHSHMCYSEFNELIEHIAQLDTDVITIESSRSKMQLLKVFEKFKYPSQIGPGVYDIHSPRIPETSEIMELLELAAEKIEKGKLWVNPDCGLKTRNWEEVEKSLQNLVEAAKEMRKKYA